MSSPKPGGAHVGAPAAAIERIAESNQAAGYHFFDPDTIRFFNSAIHPRVYGGRYFITGERCDEHHPERFTIRVALNGGQVQTVGDFQGFATHEEAEDALILALARGIETRFDPYPVRGELPNAPVDPGHFNWRAYVGELAIGVRTDRAAAERLARELTG